jgi:hypothetical protein
MYRYCDSEFSNIYLEENKNLCVVLSSLCVHLEDLRSAVLTSGPLISRQMEGGLGEKGEKGERGGGIGGKEKEGGIGGGKNKNKKATNAVLKSQNDPLRPGVSDEEECSAESYLGELVECGETAAKVRFCDFAFSHFPPIFRSVSSFSSFPSFSYFSIFSLAVAAS